MNVLKKWWSNRQKKEQDKIAESIRNEFEVVEKSGILYLIHNGVAFARIDADAKAIDVAEKLNEARDTAQEFRIQ